MDENITLDMLLRVEQQQRKKQQWLFYDGEVMNDHGKIVPVRIKAFGFYLQRFFVNCDGINYASGHTICSVRELHALIRERINAC